MKDLILISIMAAVIFFATFETAHAFDAWTPEDTHIEIAWQIGNILDTGTTLDIANNPKYHETNMILGSHPSRSKIYLYMLSSAIMHPLFTWIMPEKLDAFGYEFYPRRAFQRVSVGMTYGCVQNNFGIGLRINY